MDWLFWTLIFVGLSQSLGNVIPLIVDGDFEDYYEMWNKGEKATYMVWSKYNRRPVYAFSYPGKNNARHYNMMPNQNYIIQYDPNGNLDLLTYEPIPGDNKPNDRFVKNWESDVPLKSFMHNTMLFINSTHAMNSLQLYSKDPGMVDQKCCPIQKIEVAIPDLPPAMLMDIAGCFNMNDTQPIAPFCAFKSDNNGRSTWTMITHKYPIFYNKYDVTVYYVPKGDFNHDVLLYDHVTNITYFVPKNLTTFKDDQFVKDHQVSIRIPLVKQYDKFFQHRGTLKPSTKMTSTTEMTFMPDSSASTSYFDCSLALFLIIVLC
ncbi:hypothetical protein M3Y95_00359100 [Aphelenchoides besseyi]|nr:hypothetical protein M3Y95_00359100 [Aphelenchoides besseyi]